MVEVGAGSGQATGMLLDAGASVVAVELSRDLAERLESRYASPTLEGSALAVARFHLAPVRGWWRRGHGRAACPRRADKTNARAAAARPKSICARRAGDGLVRGASER